MTTTNLQLQALTELKAPAPKRSAKVEWAPLSLDSLAPGRYLACDQSLTACGVVLLVVEPDAVRVAEAKLFSTEPTEVQGWEDVLTRTELLQKQLADWVRDLIGGGVVGDVFTVHEAPPIGGGKFTQPEISLISAYAFRQAVMFFRPLRLPMVRRQDHAKLICGNANVKKPVEHTALKALFPRIQGSEKITNEGLRDALCVALTAAYRRAQS